MDDNWTVVNKKNKNKNKNKKPNKYLRSWNSYITKNDTILTTKQKKIIDDEKLKNPELINKLFCDCCNSSLISDIIHQSFFSCGKCYCCSGDFEYAKIVSTGTFYEYNKDYYYKNNDDYHNNCY